GQVDEDRARLEDGERTARDVVVDDGRDLLVRVERGVARRQLLLLAEVDRDHPVRQSRLLEHDGDLPSVRRRPRVEIDHVPSVPAVSFEDEPEAGCRSKRARSVSQDAEPDPDADTSPTGQLTPVPPSPQ